MTEPFWSKILLRCLQYLFHPPYPYMTVVHLKENWRQSPSWYEINLKTMHSQGSTSGKVKDEGPSSSSAADEGASQSAPAGGVNYERSDSAGANKTKTRVQYLKISSDDLWRLRDKLDRKKRSLGKTYKTSKETNDKVYALNQKTGKYLETLAVLYENFVQACTERKEAEAQFDKDFHGMLEKLAASRSSCVEASAAYDRIETNLNEVVELVRSQFAATAAATLSSTVGTADRSTNEFSYLQEALDLLDALLLRGAQEEGYEHVGKEG